MGVAFDDDQFLRPGGPRIELANLRQTRNVARPTVVSRDDEQLSSFHLLGCVFASPASENDQAIDFAFFRLDRGIAACTPSRASTDDRYARCSRFSQVANRREHVQV